MADTLHRAGPPHRADAEAKLRGEARYGVDLVAPRMLVAGLVRSPVQRGVVRRLDTSAAARLGGVVVVTAADVPTPRYGAFVRDEPAFASDRVRYAGEPLAAIAAPDHATLERALAAVRVDVEPEAGVSTPGQATAGGAALVHPDWAGYETTRPIDRDGNVCCRLTVERGDVAAAFARADLVVEETYDTARVHQGYIEPRACLAEPVPGGGLHVTSSNQHPYQVRGTLAEILGMDVSLIRVTASTVGGGFGGKLDSTLEHYACLLALASGRPVKMVSSRQEELAAAMPRENSTVRIRSAVDAGGRIVGREVTCVLDAGAYTRKTPAIAAVGSLQGSGPYRIDNVRCEAVGVYTNTQPTGAYRGPSGPQMVLALESHMDEIAGRLGVDPVEYRRRHLVTDGDVMPNGQVLESVSVSECVDRATAAIGYGEPRPPGRGVGVACAWWTTTGGAAAAEIRVDLDGTVAVSTAATEIGSGAVAAGVVGVVARALDVPPERVRLVGQGDTAAGPFDFGAQGSRTTFNVGNAAIRACDTVREQLLARAAEVMEASPDDLVLREGTVMVKGSPADAVGFAELAKSALTSEGPISASARYLAPPTPHEPGCVSADHIYPAFGSPTFHCHAVEVEVDGETGQIRVLRYVAAQDVGHALVPAAAEGQVHGGVLQGLGMALLEEEVLDGAGRIANASLEGYKLPTVLEAPDVEVILVESPSAVGPWGAKGVAEPPILLPQAAVVNAVAAATGHRFHATPLTPERVLAALPPRPSTGG